MTNRCALVLLELGIAAFDEKNNIIVSNRFTNPAQSFRSIKSGSVPTELEGLIKELSNFDYISVNDSDVNAVLRAASLKSHMMTVQEQDEIQNKKQMLLLRCGFARDEREAIRELRKFAIEISSSKVKEESQKLDLHVAQAINALDEIDQVINTLGARMREWYGLHFPELDNLLSSLTAYAEIVKRAGSRENVSEEILKTVGMEGRKVDIIISTCKRSRGGELTGENLEILQSLADQIIILSTLRRRLVEQVEFMMKTVAPNIKELLTAPVGARVIAKAGSLSKLAMLPASTIQVLGAEKALFRSLRTGANPPKHGLLFQHSLIHSAPKWQRGKIARALASKLAIAARIDLFRPGLMDSSVATRLNTRIAEIQEKYKEPRKELKRNEKFRAHGRGSYPSSSKRIKNRRDRRKLSKRRV
ncbi:MAG TPA: ribonucleotide-diphosphate reductase subunit beta [Candidatus Bathyarchaeia archaeon]|nr:ribonucleotide-diphosphate reductase subunit beta [Candidatus Bathyarchaeia archaeon]